MAWQVDESVSFTHPIIDSGNVYGIYPQLYNYTLYIRYIYILYIYAIHTRVKSIFMLFF